MRALESHRGSYLRQYFILLSAFVLATWGAAVAYYQAFSARKPFDDEGFLVGWLRNFLDGQSLYKELHCFYGPGYFFYQSLGHRILHSVPTTDSIRFISIAFWISISLLGLFLISRITGRLMLGAVGYILIFRISHFLGEEPGHPQELILLLSVLAMAAACLNRREPLRFFILGGIAGVLALTKINVGISLALALGATVLFGLRLTRSSRYFRIVCGVVIASFPPLLFWPSLGSSWAQRYLLIEICALASILVTIWPPIPAFELDYRSAVAALCGFAIGAAALIVYALAMGASMAAMVDWLLIRPRQILGSLWFFPAEIAWWQMVPAVIGLLLAAAVRFRPMQSRIHSLKLAVGAGVVLLAIGSRNGALFALAPPFMWLIAIPTPGIAGFDRVARSLVGLIAVLFFTYAYPVAGVHVRLADVLLVIVAMLLVGDAMAYGVAHWKPLYRSVRYRATPVAALVVIVIYAGWTLAAARSTYFSESPLNLPGASRLRLPSREAEELQEMVAAAARSCTFLVTVPSMLSFNHWTGLPSVSGLPFANWVRAYEDPAQVRIVDKLSSAERPCVIQNPAMTRFWTHNADVSGRPISVYTRSRMHETLRAGDNHLFTR